MDTNKLPDEVIEKMIQSMAKAFSEAANDIKRKCPCTDCAKWRLKND